ncbi:MAG: hypothetical protein ISR72_02180 [Methylobacter sp.]|nr:hypothetical protein [Methylobacter sp.]
MLILVSTTVCGEGDKPVKTADTGILKTQLHALSQVKQVEQVLQNATTPANRAGNSII